MRQIKEYMKETSKNSFEIQTSTRAEKWTAIATHKFGRASGSGVSKRYQIIDFQESDADFSKQIMVVLNYLEVERFATTKGFVDTVSIRDAKNRVIDKIPFTYYICDKFEVSELPQSRINQFKETLINTLSVLEEEYKTKLQKEAKRARDKARREREKLEKMKNAARKKDLDGPVK